MQLVVFVRMRITTIRYQYSYALLTCSHTIHKCVPPFRYVPDSSASVGSLAVHRGGAERRTVLCR